MKTLSISTKKLLPSTNAFIERQHNSEFPLPINAKKHFSKFNINGMRICEKEKTRELLNNLLPDKKLNHLQNLQSFINLDNNTIQYENKFIPSSFFLSKKSVKGVTSLIQHRKLYIPKPISERQDILDFVNQVAPQSVIDSLESHSVPLNASKLQMNNTFSNENQKIEHNTTIQEYSLKEKIANNIELKDMIEEMRTKIIKRELTVKEGYLCRECAIKEEVK